MRQFKLLIFTLILIYSCKDNPSDNLKSQSEDPVVEKSKIDSVNQVLVQQPDKNEPISKNELSNIFLKAVQVYPNDSASLYRFYFQWNSTQEQDKINRQIKRLEELTSKETVERYRSVENNLKPLMTEIVNSKTISRSQSDSLIKLYTEYDYFSGESLFSNLLTGDENYNLVWASIEIMVTESQKDTSFISGLFKLNNNISTNVELAEAMEKFKVEAIRNNPMGFLQMYGQRQGQQKTDFAYNITIWEDPVKELIDKYSEVSKTSTNENYRRLATELVRTFEQ